ncbi:hypothetical protein BD410DRAFT_747455 [Rickenella mellea]|uniref:DNA replication licensing factor MCM6 n=1 Tax=Rickenella mellea TaxID=50990 RepID=A0A4Y7Q7T6_9AGAM|nr:hypothetical protein BD410DRAFT_747455 [Rickenella mellea]
MASNAADGIKLEPQSDGSLSHVEDTPESPTENATTEPQHQPQAPPKRIYKITHDQYMQMQSVLVMHVSDAEKRLSKGIGRDELIDWYLELKEQELQSIEDLVYEKGLIGKVLKKLVKDNYLMEIRGDCQETLPESMDTSESDSNLPDGSTLRVSYMVHPSVNTDLSPFD